MTTESKNKKLVITESKFSPETHIFSKKVYGILRYYEVTFPEAYMDKCKKNGDQVKYEGKTDEKGRLYV